MGYKKGYSVEIRYTHGLYAPQRQVVKWLKEANRGAGEWWHAKYRRRHFTMDAMRRYNYTPRTRGYNRYKRAKHHHALPLVKTGDSRDLSERKRVMAKLDSVHVRMPVRAFNYRKANWKVNMLEEFRAFSPDEIKTIENRTSSQIVRSMNKYKRQQTKRK